VGPYHVKKKIVEKPPRNSAGFCGEGQGLKWAVEPRKEEEGSLPCAQQPVIGPYPEPDETSSHTHTLFP
jgi:hypothetical protein